MTKRYVLETSFREDQEIRIEFAVQPAEHDVGIMSAYPDDVCVFDASNNQEITDLTEDESALLDDKCMEYVNELYESQMEDRAEQERDYSFAKAGA